MLGEVSYEDALAVVTDLASTQAQIYGCDCSEIAENVALCLDLPVPLSLRTFVFLGEPTYSQRMFRVGEGVTPAWSEDFCYHTVVAAYINGELMILDATQVYGILPINQYIQQLYNVNRVGGTSTLRFYVHIGVGEIISGHYQVYTNRCGVELTAV